MSSFGPDTFGDLRASEWEHAAGNWHAAHLATTLGVSADAVSLAVSSASVLVTATVTFTDRTAAAANANLEEPTPQDLATAFSIGMKNSACCLHRRCGDGESRFYVSVPVSE